MRRSFSGSPFVKPSIISNQRGGSFNPNTPVNTPSGLISFLFFFFFLAVNKRLLYFYWVLFHLFYNWVGLCFYSNFYLKIACRVWCLFMVWLVYKKMWGSKGKDRKSLH
jgi:hypothetical protein